MNFFLGGGKQEELLSLIDSWLKRKNIGALAAEPHYRNMKPCVIAEELLLPDEGESSLTDYKIWCFRGKASYIWVCRDRSKDGSSAHVMTYDLDWNPHPEFSIFDSDYLQAEPIPQPANLDRMIEVAERISKGFPEVRVDLYSVGNKVYFGEMTFTSQGGLMKFFSEDFLMECGKKFDVSDFPRKK